MSVKSEDIVYRERPTYTHFWLTGTLEKTCGANPITLPPGSTVNDAVAQFQAQVNQLTDEQELQQYVRIPMPLDIAKAADAYLQQVLDNLTDMHNTLKRLNLYGSTDNATEATVNSEQDTKALTVKNALIAYRNGWVRQFDTEQSDAKDDPAGWKAALKQFVSSNLGNLDWLKEK